MQAENLEVAAAAIVMLGQGKYMLKGLDTDKEVPFFIFGGHDEWFIEQFGHDLSKSLEKVGNELKQELIQVFDSVLIGGLEDREAYDAAIAKIEGDEERAAYRDKFLDAKRSSLNNICARAWQYAAHFRTQA